MGILYLDLLLKELALHGFEMSLGIKHHSKENPFNLADDIIEVFVLSLII